jgi:hypothetical protein
MRTITQSGFIQRIVKRWKVSFKPHVKIFDDAEKKKIEAMGYLDRENVSVEDVITVLGEKYAKAVSLPQCGECGNVPDRVVTFGYDNKKFNLCIRCLNDALKLTND